MDQHQILTTIKTHLPTLQAAYKVESLGLFGSFARHEQTSESDIDVLAEFCPDADLFDLLGLNLRLEEIFACRVDVVPKKAVREELRESILSQVVYP